jgi:hypothetical protein
MNLSKLGIRGVRNLSQQPKGFDVHCPKRYCGTRLRLEVQLGGVVVAICDLCERNRRGLCRRCPQQLTFKGKNRGNAQFCDDCRAANRADYDERWYWANRDEQLRLAKRRHRLHRVERLAYAARYRKAHPKKRDDLDRLYHRTWMRTAWADPVWHARELRRRNRLRLAKRKARVLAGEAVKLTDRDVIWIWEKALGRRLDLALAA